MERVFGSIAQFGREWKEEVCISGGSQKEPFFPIVWCPIFGAGVNEMGTEFDI